jgi:hypothetical protein
VDELRQRIAALYQSDDMPHFQGLRCGAWEPSGCERASLTVSVEEDDRCAQVYGEGYPLGCVATFCVDWELRRMDKVRVNSRFFHADTSNKYTVNPEIQPPGALFFNLLFWKKLFNKNAINSHFSFFWPYKSSEGGSITGGGALFQDLLCMYKYKYIRININI